LNEKMTSFWT